MAGDSTGLRGRDLKIQFEREAWNQGKQRVAGLDEVGRGPLAGPVVAACVVLRRDIFFRETPAYFYEVDDSKKLLPSKRARLACLLESQKELEIGIGLVDQDTIDEINILEATRLAMCRAIDKLSAPPDHLLIDGVRLPSVTISQNNVIKGDSLSFSIGAASIVAKVYRDRLMETYDAQYPAYGFGRHKGYGTSEHLENLNKYGPCSLHRKSFVPVRKAAALAGSLT